MGCSSVPCTVFLFLFSGGLILAGTTVTWNREDELGYTSTNGAALFRYNQLLFWMEWILCLIAYISKHSMYNSMAAAVLVAVVARRQGSGIASFERVDFYRIAADSNTTAFGLNATTTDFRQAAAGGVASYFGAIFSWIISLPGLEFSDLNVVWIIVLLCSAVMGTIGNIVLWTSDAIAQSSTLRNTVFDTTMYTLWALMFAMSATFCNLAPVLTTIMFFCMWVMLTEFGNMFYVQEVLVREGGGEDTQIWAGYCLTWGAIFLANIAIANTLWSSEVVFTKFARTMSRKKSRVGPAPHNDDSQVEEHPPRDVIPPEDDIATVFDM